jgi:hypothetical protein
MDRKGKIILYDNLSLVLRALEDISLQSGIGLLVPSKNLQTHFPAWAAGMKFEKFIPEG